MKKRTIGVTAISGLLLIGCGGDSKTSQSTTSQSAMPMGQEQPPQEATHSPGDEAAMPQPSIDVGDWQSWTKVNDSRFLSKAHNNMWVDIYVPAGNVDAYRNPSASLEELRVVKAQYPDENAAEAKNITLMVRDESTESNWFWGIYGPDGTSAMDAGQIDSCISCHQSATDMLFRQLQ